MSQAFLSVFCRERETTIYPAPRGIKFAYVKFNSLRNPLLQNFEINEFHDFEESWFSVIDSYTIRKPRSVFMPSKVPFQVVYCSSSDDNHREKELEVCVSFFLVFSSRFLLAIQKLESCVNWKQIQIQEHTSVGARPYSHWNKGHGNCVCTWVCATCRVKV